MADIISGGYGRHDIRRLWQTLYQAAMADMISGGYGRHDIMRLWQT